MPPFRSSFSCKHLLKIIKPTPYALMWSRDDHVQLAQILRRFFYALTFCTKMIFRVIFFHFSRFPVIIWHFSCAHRAYSKPMPVFMHPAARALRRPAATGFERSVVTTESKRPPLSLAVHHVLFSLLSSLFRPPPVLRSAHDRLVSYRSSALGSSDPPEQPFSSHYLPRFAIFCLYLYHLLTFQSPKGRKKPTREHRLAF